MPQITIRKAEPEDIHKVREYVRGKYQERFQTSPVKIAEDCFLAIKDDLLVGVVTAEFSSGEEFELERLFDFDFNSLHFERIKAVSFGRWISDDRRAAPALGLAAISFSMNQGREFSLSCAKPNLMRYLAKHYGLVFDRIFTAIHFEQVPEQDKNFFCVKPYPALYTGRIDQWYNALKDRISSDVIFQL